MDKSSLKITTINAKSLKSETKWIIMDCFLSENLPDFCFVQETNITSIPKFQNSNKYSFHINPSIDEYSGTMIAIKKISNLQVLQNNILYGAFLQEILVKVNSEEWHLVNIYLPHNKNTAHEVLNSLRNFLRKSAHMNANIILGGDFNCTLNPTFDRHGSTERYPQLANKLRDIVISANLGDSWRDLYNNKIAYTFVTPGNASSSSRLDRLYCTQSITKALNSAKISISFSDHFAYTIWVNVKKTYTPPPYWKFDNHLLQDDCFVQTLETFIVEETAKRPINSDTLCHWWDNFKRNLKQMIILYKRQKRRSAQMELESLEKQIQYIFSFQLHTDDDIQELSTIMKRARDWFKRKTEKILENTNYEYLVLSDCPSLNRNVFSSSKPMKRLRHLGNIIEQPLPLATCIHDHFVSKFHSDGQEIDETSSIYQRLPRLDSENQTSLCCPINEDELHTALMSLKKGSSPGLDGLTTEFYIVFWKSIGSVFHAVVTKSLEKQRLPSSMTKAVIALLPKKGDPLCIENWRAVSILPTDYKVLAKALSRRLSGILGLIIDADQSYSIPNRTIFDSLHLHRDLIAHVNHVNEPLAILSLDQKAAFDNIEHRYLFHVMEQFNLGEFFINAVKTLYKNAFCHVKVTNLLTSAVPFLKGIRQGCPLSGPLYSLSIEPLLCICRRSLKGISFPDLPSLQLTVAAYADDISIFISKDEDFQMFQTVYNQFSKESGSSLNTSKSVGFWTGQWKGRTDSPLSFHWSSDNIKVLGVTFSSDIYSDTHAALLQLTEKTKTAINKWVNKLPYISIVGRKSIINRSIAPKLWHQLQVLPFSETQLNQLQKLMVSFIWRGRHWLSSEHLHASIRQGGLGLVHLISKSRSFRIHLIQKLVNHTEQSKWKVLVNHFLETSNSWKFTWQWFFLPQNKIPSANSYPFIQSLLDVMHASPNITIDSFPKSFPDVRKIPLTVSRLLRPLVPPLFSTKWFENGFYTVADFVSNEKIWITQELLSEKLQAVSPAVRNELLCHFRRVKAIVTRNYKTLPSNDAAAAHQLSFLSRNNRTIQINKQTRKLLQQDLTSRFFGTEEVLPNTWTDDEVHWSSFFNRPTLANDGEISWRLAKNRLADPVFLQRAGLRDSNFCPFCPTSIGTAWHQMFNCTATTRIWNLVEFCIKNLTGMNFVRTEDLLCGYKNKTPAYNLANFLVTLAKSIIYRGLIGFVKDNRRCTSYHLIFKHRAKARIIQEYSWYLGKNKVSTFEDIWCIKNAVCSITGGSLAFSDVFLN